VEVYGIIDALEPIDEVLLDNDLRAIVGWMIEGVGVHGRSGICSKPDDCVVSRQRPRVDVPNRLRQRRDLCLPITPHRPETDPAISAAQLISVAEFNVPILTFLRQEVPRK
jgi:hypothetical protein